jgi:iron complex transport system substrate-binding protein
MASDQAKLTRPSVRTARFAAGRLRRRIACVVVILTGMASIGPIAQNRPQRIISLVPNITEMLFAIGAGPRVVAVGSFDDFPPEVARLPRVGALLDPDVEKILSLRPDLVAVYETQDDLRSQLDRAKIPQFVSRHAGLGDVMTTIRALGARTGNEGEADRVASGLDRQLSAVRERVAGRPRPRTLLVFGRDTEALRNVNVSGAVGFLHDLLVVAGGANAIDVARQSVQLNVESMLALAPEVIVELRYTKAMTQADIDRASAEWNLLASAPAVRSRRVYVLVGDEFVVPGPRIGGAAERLARALHPLGGQVLNQRFLHDLTPADLGQTANTARK